MTAGPTPAGRPASAPGPATVRVWDPVVRIFHWSLVSAVALAWVVDDPRKVHRALGYTVAALLVIRLVWGLIGPRHARFADFVRGPRTTLAYIAAMLRGREARHLGHNPAGAAMVVVLMATLTAICVTGYMMGMSRYFGQDWVEHLHKTCVNLLLLLIAGHLGGVLLASLRHRENLVTAMITGQKSAHDPSHPGAGDTTA